MFPVSVYKTYDTHKVPFWRNELRQLCGAFPVKVTVKERKASHISMMTQWLQRVKQLVTDKMTNAILQPVDNKKVIFLDPGHMWLQYSILGRI